MLLTRLTPPVASGQVPEAHQSVPGCSTVTGAAAGHQGRGERPPRLAGTLLGSTLCTQQEQLTFPRKQLLAARRSLAAHTAPLSHASPGFLGGLGHRRGKRSSGTGCWPSRAPHPGKQLFPVKGGRAEREPDPAPFRHGWLSGLRWTQTLTPNAGDVRREHPGSLLPRAPGHSG